MNNIPDNEFLMNKRDFVLNSLTLGVAVELFANASGRSPNDCLVFLVQQAQIKILHQTPESVEEFITQYYTGRQNKVQAVVVNFPNSKTA